MDPRSTSEEYDALRRDLGPSLERIVGAVPEFDIVRLRGDASTRIYYRLALPEADRLGAPRTLIVMRLPEDALRSDEGTSADRPAELPFSNMQRFLAARGVSVPKIFAEDLPRRVLCLEDLGDETFEARLLREGDGAWPGLYGRAVDFLADLHRRAEPQDRSSVAFTRAFDEPLLRWELEHFVEWGLVAPFGHPPEEKLRALRLAFDALAKQLAAAPPHFVHRDFQSRNLMWHGDRLVVIDFQDALLGPAPYDLVALLCDSYVALSESLQASLIERYLDARGVSAQPERAAFVALFWRTAAQRKLKDAGRFVFIDRVRGNPSFLPSFPQSLVYAGRALDKVPELREVADILRQTIPGFPDGVAVPASVPPAPAPAAE